MIGTEYKSNLLPIIDYADYQDWQKEQYHYDYGVGLIMCPTLKLLPFITPNILHDSSNHIHTFSLKRISINGATKTVLQTTALSTSLLTFKQGITYDCFYFAATTDLSAVTPGLYEFYIEDHNGNKFKSEVFCIPNATLFEDCNPDFNNDFNNDHLICES